MPMALFAGENDRPANIGQALNKRAEAAPRINNGVHTKIRRGRARLPRLPQLFRDCGDVQPGDQPALSCRPDLHAAGLRPRGLVGEPNDAGHADHRAPDRLQRARRPRCREGAGTDAGERPARQAARRADRRCHRRFQRRRRFQAASRCATSTPSVSSLPAPASTPSSTCRGRRSISASSLFCIRFSASSRWAAPCCCC